MKSINKENLESFMSFYHDFQGSSIISIEYDILNSRITIVINVLGLCKTSLNRDKSEVKILFEDVYKCNNKEIFLWDNITKAYLKYVHLDNEEYICFADDGVKPSLYIVCKSMKYQVL